MANKELSFGCNLIIYNPTWRARFIEKEDVWNGFSIMYATDWYSVLSHKDDLKEYEIIWHDVMIWDIYKYIDTNSNWIREYQWVMTRDLEVHSNLIISIYNYFIWRHHLPIEKQDQQCIDYVYNLIVKEK